MKLLSYVITLYTSEMDLSSSNKKEFFPQYEGLEKINFMLEYFFVSELIYWKWCFWDIIMIDRLESGSDQNGEKN